MTTLKRVLIIAGGTGGHVFPGLAFARYLQDQNVQVDWLGTPQGIETKLVPLARLPFYTVMMSGIRGKGIRAWIHAPWMVSMAIWQAIRIIRQLKPQVVIGMGGFVSAPGGIASWLLRRPLIIHEQNAHAGWANQLLSRLATRCCAGFETTFATSKKKPIIVMGNPIRSEIMALPPPRQRLLVARSPFRLLVLGGSLGAKALNELLPQALAKLSPTERPLVMHQTGDRHFEDTKKLYQSIDCDVQLKPFIDDMVSAYAWADLVCCRAGALTIAELCTVGLGAILVPYPFAVDNHQSANAAALVKGGAALCFEQATLTADRLAAVLKQLAHAPDKRLNMAEAAYRLRRVNVVQKMYDLCQEVIA